MPSPPRRRLAPDVRRQEILDAAERLLRTRGSAVRVEDVVREAGAAKGTFFLYFPSWDDLLEAIRARLIEGYDAAYPLPTEVDGPIDWPAVIDRQAAAFIDFTRNSGGIHEAVFHGDFATRRPQGVDAVVRLSAIIRAGQEADAFGPIDPEPTARLLFAAIHEAADAVAAGADRDATLRALTTILRRTLAR